MMKVLQLRADPFYQGFDFINREQRLIFRELKKSLWGQPIGEKWKPIGVIVPKEEQHLPKCDFPELLPDVPVFSRRAKELLTDLLVPFGEFLPLLTDTGEYYAFNVINRIDVLNEKKSELERFPDGRVMRVVKYEFYPEKIQDQLIFQIPQETTRIYVTDKFVENVKEYNLTGFEYLPLWSYEG